MGGLYRSDVRSDVAGLQDSIVKFVGGTNAVTKVLGRGVTVTYVSAGIVNLVWAESPGTFAGVTGYCFQATTAADVKNYILVPGVWNSTTWTLVLNMTESSTLTNLAALEWLTLRVSFMESDV